MFNNFITSVYFRIEGPPNGGREVEKKNHPPDKFSFSGEEFDPENEVYTYIDENSGIEKTYDLAVPELNNDGEVKSIVFKSSSSNTKDKRFTKEQYAFYKEGGASNAKIIKTETDSGRSNRLEELAKKTLDKKKKSEPLEAGSNLGGKTPEERRDYWGVMEAAFFRSNVKEINFENLPEDSSKFEVSDLPEESEEFEKVEGSELVRSSESSSDFDNLEVSEDGPFKSADFEGFQEVEGSDMQGNPSPEDFSELENIKEGEIPFKEVEELKEDEAEQEGESVFSNLLNSARKVFKKLNPSDPDTVDVGDEAAKKELMGERERLKAEQKLVDKLKQDILNNELKIKGEDYIKNLDKQDLVDKLEELNQYGFNRDELRKIIEDEGVDYIKEEASNKISSGSLNTEPLNDQAADLQEDKSSPSDSLWDKVTSTVRTKAEDLEPTGEAKGKLEQEIDREEDLVKDLASNLSTKYFSWFNFSKEGSSSSFMEKLQKRLDDENLEEGLRSIMGNEDSNLKAEEIIWQYKDEIGEKVRSQFEKLSRRADLLSKKSDYLAKDLEGKLLEGGLSKQDLIKSIVKSDQFDFSEDEASQLVDALGFEYIKNDILEPAFSSNTNAEKFETDSETELTPSKEILIDLATDYYIPDNSDKVGILDLDKLEDLDKKTLIKQVEEKLEKEGFEVSSAEDFVESNWGSLEQVKDKIKYEVVHGIDNPEGDQSVLGAKIERMIEEEQEPPEEIVESKTVSDRISDGLKSIVPNRLKDAFSRYKGRIAAGALAVGIAGSLSINPRETDTQDEPSPDSRMTSVEDIDEDKSGSGDRESSGHTVDKRDGKLDSDKKEEETEGQEEALEFSEEAGEQVAETVNNDVEDITSQEKEDNTPKTNEETENNISLDRAYDNLLYQLTTHNVAADTIVDADEEKAKEAIANLLTLEWKTDIAKNSDSVLKNFEEGEFGQDEESWLDMISDNIRGQEIEPTKEIEEKAETILKEMKKQESISNHSIESTSKELQGYSKKKNFEKLLQAPDALQKYIQYMLIDKDEGIVDFDSGVMDSILASIADAKNFDEVKEIVADKLGYDKDTEAIDFATLVEENHSELTSKNAEKIAKDLFVRALLSHYDVKQTYVNNISQEQGGINSEQIVEDLDKIKEELVGMSNNELGEINSADDVLERVEIGK